IPLAQGAAPDGVHFALCDENDNPVPLQTSVLARWKDGSARWVLLDFQAEPPPDATAHFKLSWGKKLKAVNPEFPVVVNKQGKPSIRTRTVVVSLLGDALLRISDRVDLGLTMTDSEGEECTATVESVDVQTEGEIRSTLLLRGAFRDTDGQRVLGFRMQISVFAGLSKIYLEPQILIDSEMGIVHHLRDLEFAVTPLDGMRSATVGGRPEWSGTPTTPVRLFQVDDQNYRFEGARGSGSKAPGWAEMDDGRGTVAIALRDFWQQWPKSIEVDSKGLAIGLFPKFERGAFDHMEPWYKYQYLFEDNRYLLRTGQAPRWRIWLDLSGDGPSLVQAANAPLVPSADPAQVIASGTWGNIAPAGGPGMKQYDDWAENLFDNGYCRSIEVQRDYGQMNWGDWFGERRCNWGNHEYDTAKHILVQFARTGDPKYFYVGDAAARHTSEIDVIRFVNDDLKRHFEEDLGGRSAYPVRPGMVHEHCVGHVSGFYSVERVRDLYATLGNGSHLCLAPYNLGHIWTQGMVYDYFLTGDPWVKETVERIGDNLAKLVEEREFNFKTGSHVGRVNGWTMLAIAGAYELDLNERYLNAMRLLADDAISAQDPHCGGWLWELPSGHCNCGTKHVGEAGFIGSVSISTMIPGWNTIVTGGTHPVLPQDGSAKLALQLLRWSIV
ncbi:MAG: RIFT barrel domain-containing protein, partial [Planctomycetota bacterium]